MDAIYLNSKENMIPDQQWLVPNLSHEIKKKVIKTSHY